MSLPIVKRIIIYNMYGLSLQREAGSTYKNTQIECVRQLYKEISKPEHHVAGRCEKAIDTHCQYSAGPTRSTLRPLGRASSRLEPEKRTALSINVS